MKKLLSFLALALCFVACQNEAVESVNNSDLANVVLTIDAPELGVTRADLDANAAKNSAFGAIDFLTDADWANYDLRYILEVYKAGDEGTGEPIYRERLVNCLDKYAPTTFDLRLVPNRKYKFVVFADFVAEGSAEAEDKLAIADLYYNTADLRNISAITDQPTWNAMNEIRDAYFITKDVEVGTSLNETLTLTRPFAKLRVIATDLDYIAGYSKPGYVEVTYKDEPVYKSFNAVSGYLNTEEMDGNELKYGFEVNKNIPYTEGYDALASHQTLFTDYLLAKEGEQTAVNFEMAVFESKGGQLIHKHDFNTQIPIQRNHLTTIIGDLLTTQANITIEIDDNFDGEFINNWIEDENGNLVYDGLNGWTAGELNTNNNYEFDINDGTNSFTLIVPENAIDEATGKISPVKNAEFVASEDNLKENTFTIKDFKVDATTRAAADATVTTGTMNITESAAGVYVQFDLYYSFNPEAEYADSHNIRLEFEGDVKAKTPLATPAVKAAVEGNVITLTWEAVENAVAYSITGTEMPVVTEETSYTFTGEYETEYTFNVVAVPADEDMNYPSEPATVTATTEAKPALATPAVKAAVEGNVITLTWEAVENAAAYSITGTEMPVVTEETSYTFTGEYETEYTFNVVAVPADEDKFTVSEAATVTATTEAAPVELGYKLYFNNIAEWTNVYAHIWANDGEDLGLESVEWPGRKLTETEEINGVTYYVFQLPAEATGKTVNVVFNDGAGTQTKDLAGVVEGNLFFDNYVEPVAPSDVVLYLQPNKNWNIDGARFAAYFFGNGETWVDMTLVEGETNIYAVTVPTGFENIIFCRMNPGAAANNWNNKWNQTADLKVPTDGTNLYTVKEDTWDNGGGEWSVYAPAVEAEVVFTKDNRTTFTTSQQVFEANDIKVINDKGSSTSNVADYVAPARFYKGSKITVSAPGNITTIVFDCNSESYATALKNSGLTGTVSVSSDKVTVILDGSSNEYVISSLTGGQVRMDSVTVTYLQ